MMSVSRLNILVHGHLEHYLHTPQQRLPLLLLLPMETSPTGCLIFQGNCSADRPSCHLIFHANSSLCNLLLFPFVLFNFIPKCFFSQLTFSKESGRERPNLFRTHTSQTDGSFFIHFLLLQLCRKKGYYYVHGQIDPVAVQRKEKAVCILQ